MSQKYEKLKTLLRELFQLDQPDLDFGLYRIMHAKSAEVSQFLHKDLLPQVKAAFGAYKTADKAELERELAKAVEQAQGLGVDPETTQKVKDLRAKLASEAVDLGQLESEVYDHLFSFFRRYYSEGDFLAKRVYKPGVYAIPYEGEEVTLHWANKDQYYIKTSEYLRDYAFRLCTDDGKNPMRVHFRLVDAAEGEHGNVKAAEGKDRVFILAAGGDSGRDFIAEADGEQGKELSIRFEYRPATLLDWPEDVREGKTKPPAQKDLSADAVKRILAVADASLLPWVTELGKPHVLASGEKADYTRLEAHLRRYTARNTFDYFIHKDLGGFLRRELDFYIKNEVMHLDDVENESAPRVEQYLSKIKVIRRIAGKIIAFLAQLEDFQKKLWLKRKFVVSSEYCIALGSLPEDLAAQVAACQSVQQSWIELGSSDAAKPIVPVDTALLPPALRDKVIESVDVGSLGGTLMIGDNRDGLDLAHRFLRGRVRMVYMDPPFNTGTDGFAYKDSYMHSSWLSMMQDRIEQLVHALAEDGTLYAHIDYEEKERLKLLLDLHLTYITEVIWRIGWLSGYKTKANKFIRNHDTIYQYSRSPKPFFRKTYIPYPEGYVRRDGNAPEGAGYPIEDTWNCSELDSMNSIQIISFSKEKVGDDSLTQKNESLLKRAMVSSSNEGDLVVDPFLGSGTTAAVAMKLGRRWLCCEVADRALRSAVPRLKRVIGGDPYGISRDPDVQWSGGSGFAYVELESYEDALNNLESRRTEAQRTLLDATEAQGAGGLREQYLLRYMLDVETRGSQSLLNVQAFSDPTAYKLKVKRPGSDESREVNVDLLETFNWLIGLTVRHIAAPQAFSAAFERDSEKRLRLKGRLKQEDSGPFWFRTVTGATPDGRKTLVIWRKLTGDPEEDNLVLDEWFTKQGYKAKDSEFDLIYVNGGNNLENLKAPDDTWKVRLIEEDFHRLMFDTAGA